MALERTEKKWGSTIVTLRTSSEGPPSQYAQTSTLIGRRCVTLCPQHDDQ